MRGWLQSHKTEVYLFLFAFGVRFVYALVVQGVFGEHGFLAYSDAFSFYLKSAHNLVSHGVFSLSDSAPFVPDAYRPPLYIVLVAGALSLKLPLLAVICVQNILGGCIAVLGYRIAQHIGASVKVALCVGIATTLEPMGVYWNNLLMSDTLYTALFLFSVDAFIARRYYTFAIVFGLASLTRTVGLYFFPIFLLAWLWRDGGIRAWRQMVLSGLIFVAALSPWMMRNYAVFGTPELLSASWYNLYLNVMRQFSFKEGFTLPIPAALESDPHPEVSAYHFSFVPFYREHFFMLVRERPISYGVFHASLTVTSLLKNPYDYLVTYVLKQKVPQLQGGFPGAFASVVSTMGGILLIALYPLSLLAFLDRRYRLWLTLFFCLFVLNALSLGALGLGADMSRYLMPFVPLLVLFSIVGIQALRARLMRTSHTAQYE